MMRNLATVLPWILNTAFTSNPIQLTDENGSAMYLLRFAKYQFQTYLFVNYMTALSRALRSVFNPWFNSEY